MTPEEIDRLRAELDAAPVEQFWTKEGPVDHRQAVQWPRRKQYALLDALQAAARRIAELERMAKAVSAENECLRVYEKQAQRERDAERQRAESAEAQLRAFLVESHDILRRAEAAEAERDRLRQENERLRAGIIQDNYEIHAALCPALFPGPHPEGVCGCGELIPPTLAKEAAGTIERLRASSESNSMIFLKITQEKNELWDDNERLRGLLGEWLDRLPECYCRVRKEGKCIACRTREELEGK